MSSESPSSQALRVFPNTRWSVVFAARQPSPEVPETLETLEAICRAYWHPLNRR